MGKGRSKHHAKELDQLDRLKHENQKLKKQISQLRKQISKVDLAKYENLQELVEQQYAEDQIVHKQPVKKDLKKQWECRECGEGYLKIIILNRPDGVFYFRRCSSCTYRTRLKKYTDDVQGIREDSQNVDKD